MTNSRTSLDAAKAASDEAKSKKNRTFTWTWSVETEGTDGELTTVPHEITLEVPRKYKRLKFTRLFAAGNIPGAIELLWGPEVAERLEEIEMDEDEAEKFLDSLGQCLAGTSAKN